jgi:solute carrier family 27 fatty acid transporter 1/4
VISTDKVCYIYTSGTTGLPKACNIKHVRYFSLQQGVNLMAEIRPDDVVYCTLPLYHTNGGMLSSGQMMFTGATLVIRKKFSASNFWQDCIKYKCTVSSDSEQRPKECQYHV